MPDSTTAQPEAPNLTQPQPKPLKSTLNLPQTPFPMKANLPGNEPQRLARWQTADLYARIQQARADSPRYILHDGPPYANGAIHLGHALNKCIKDFVVKSRTMAGFHAPFVPGWDCHGLPIEIKVDEKLGRKKLDMPAIAVRRACREYAQKFVDLQRSQFERLGIFGRWQDPYLTMSFGYESSILETFYAFFERGFVYKGLKPVYWCIHDQTALAEAEVEYAMHTSPSVYVRYRLTADPAAIAPELAAKSDVYTIIWTTTPWTLPASLAVAFNPELPYVALRNEVDGSLYLVAEALADHVRKACNLPDAPVVATFPGTALDRATFQHPFLDREILGVNADYVTTEQGTGAVHTAPSHGADDFATGTRYGLSQLCDVDAAGRLRNSPPDLGYEGLTIFEANPVITALVRDRGALMGSADLLHSYPHCWRCHNPVIFRATEQWFISMETPVTLPDGRQSTFRQQTLDQIATVQWDPAWGEHRIANMIATRPDWCISRQRIWGVPIAVFLCERCHTPLNSPSINQSVVDLFAREGADAWYTRSAADLLPAGTACAACGSQDSFRKEMDILDVWFESGSSWHAVLDQDPTLRRPPEDIPADLYTEGGDQHRGWFHSSLLTSVALRGHAPYKRVATSGWTLDEQGRAFSKSLGNGVDPVDVANRLGAEIVRLWVASVDFREDVAASEHLMARVSDNYRKLRNTLRFLLGNLHDFTPATDAIEFSEMESLDQYILTRTAELDASIRRAYDDFEFHRAYGALNEFTNTELSALYCDLIKDRLYTFAPASRARRSAQTALWRIAEALTRLIAPILSFTADEVWEQLPPVPNREPSVHLALFPDLADIIPGNTPALAADWQQLLDVRSAVLKHIELGRKAGYIGKSLDVALQLVGNDREASVLKKYEQVLPELFSVSQVKLILVDQQLTLDMEDLNNELEQSGQEILVADTRFVATNIGVLALHSESAADVGDKCERCWRYIPDVGQSPDYPSVCLRCADALAAIHHPPYTADDSGPEAHA